MDFRDLLIAASLKQKSSEDESTRTRELPRSIDRGLIEACKKIGTCFHVPASFRDLLIAASLKRANGKRYFRPGAASAIY